MTINPLRSSISFFPSSDTDLFSVKLAGKVYELASWQKKAIVITELVGILLFGIGVLFALGLSFYFRTKLVEQLKHPELLEAQEEEASADNRMSIAEMADLQLETLKKDTPTLKPLNLNDLQ